MNRKPTPNFNHGSVKRTLNDIGYGNRDDEGRSIKSSSSTIFNKRPLEDLYDDLDNLTAEELRYLKRRTPLQNADLLGPDDEQRLQNAFISNIQKPISLENGNGGGDDDNEETKKNNKITKANDVKLLFYEVSHQTQDVKKSHFSHYKIERRSKEEKALYKWKVFNHITELLMKPILYNIKGQRQIKNTMTPMQLISENSLNHGESRGATVIKTSKVQLQNHIVTSYFNHKHLTFIELVFLMESHTGAILKKVILSIDNTENDNDDQLLLFIFEWDKTESLFVFFMCFMISDNTFMNYLKLEEKRGETGCPKVVHLHRQDIITDEEEEDDEQDFFIHKQKNMHSNIMNSNGKTLYNGTIISEDLLYRLIFSHISYLHYGYTLSSVVV